MSWEYMWLKENTGIKSIQRGKTAAAGDIIISPIDLDKSYVISTSKGSSGYVAARGTVASHGVTGTVAATTSTGTLAAGTSTAKVDSTTKGLIDSGTGTVTITDKARSLSLSNPAASASLTGAAAAISGGTTDLVTKQYSAWLVDESTINCDGPVEWQVIEFH